MYVQRGASESLGGTAGSFSRPLRNCSSVLSILRKADGPDLQLAGFQHIGRRLHAKAVYKTFGIDIDALNSYLAASSINCKSLSSFPSPALVKPCKDIHRLHSLLDVVLLEAGLRLYQPIGFHSFYYDMFHSINL